MKARTFRSFEDYEKWTDLFENTSDYQEIPVDIDDGWKVSADLLTECKSWKTALKRFRKTFADIGNVSDWVECIQESCENGYFEEITGWKPAWTNDPKVVKEWQERGTFSWGVEEVDEGIWYIYLNISGIYADREIA